jgi:tetratricopeptide (TPR) repeat protein
MSEDDIARLREKVRIEPDNPIPKAELGKLLLSLQRYAEAESLFRDCTRLRPGQAEYHALLGRVLSALGRRPEAGEAFGKAVQREPGNPEFHADLGRNRSGQGRHAEAETAFRQALHIGPGTASHFAGLGRALAEQGRYQDAESALREAAQRDLGNPGYRDDLGEALARQERHADAEVLFREAITLDPTAPAYHTHLGRALAGQGRLTEAEAAFRESIQLPPGSAPAHIGLGQALAGLGRVAEAEAAFRDAIRLRPDSAPAHGGLGSILAHQTRYREAAAAFRRAARAEPDNAAYHAGLGHALAAQGHYEEAEIAFRQAVRAEPGQPAHHADLGRALLSQESLDDAERELRKAVQLDPGNPRYQADLGQALLSRGKFSDAEKLFREAMRVDRSNPAYRAGLARALSAQGNFTQAEKLLRELVQDDQGAAEYRAELGRALHDTGRHPEAQRLFREAIRLDANNPEYRALLGRLLVLNEGPHREAHGLFLEAVRLAPDNANYQADLGRSLLAHREFAAAEDALREAVRLDPANPAHTAEFGRALCSQGRYAEATPVLQQAVRLDPGNPLAQADLARALSEQGSHPDAEEAFREAVRLDRANPAYHAGLGRSLIAQTRYAQSEEAFREAVRLDRANPAYHADLGRSLSAQERHAEAQDVFRTAVRLDPANSGRQAELGLTYVRQDHLSWAENILTQLLGVDPGAGQDGVADLQRALTEAYDDKIVSYSCELAERNSDKSDLQRDGVDLREYRDHVPQIARVQLPNLRSAYHAWLEARRHEESERRHMHSSSRSYWLKAVGIWCIIAGALSVGVWLFADKPPEWPGEVRRLAEAVSLAAVVLGISLQAFYFWRIRQERPKPSRASLIFEDQLATLVSNLVLKPAKIAALQISWKDSAVDRVIVRDGPELSAKAERANLISTDANSRLDIALSRNYGAAVALAGPRGSGKTELARTSTELRPLEPPNRKIPLMLWAPAKYDAQTFLLRLLKELCISIISVGSGGAQEYDRLYYSERRRQLRFRLLIAGGLTGLGLAILGARMAEVKISTLAPFVVGGILTLAGAAVFVASRGPRPLNSDSDAPIRRPTIERAIELRTRVEYTETQTRDAKLGISGYGLSVATAKGSQFARVPLNEVDVVRELRGLVKNVAEDGWQVVIAIDELDKMCDADEAMAFLNHIKVLFPIHDCSFIVSVSEDAWARFESRGLPLRDTFDSSFDEVVLVNMLQPLESRDFLKRRSNSITDAQTLVCHCLSGGLARDLLRAARLLAHVSNRVQGNDESEPPLLCDVLTALLRKDLNDKLRASGIRARSDRGSGIQVMAAWPEIWPDPDETERWLAGACRDHEGRASVTASLETPEDAGCGIPGANYIEAYIAVLHTIRQAFSPGGPLGRLGQRSPASDQLLEGFHAIASARWYLASDIEIAWKRLHEARMILGLKPLDTPP